MSVSVDADVSSPLSEGQSTLDATLSKSSSDSQSLKEDIGVGQDNDSSIAKPHPMAFTIDFGDGKSVDNKRLEELAKKSLARHQRVQSMSGSVANSLIKPNPTLQRPPMSAKLPRKTQGYNSEGYFSSDQEDSGLSNSIKARSSVQKPNKTSPVTTRHIKSPVNEAKKCASKSPIVDSIMTRSENFTTSSRYCLNLPLKSTSYVKEVQRTPSYGNLYHPKPLLDIVDSPEVMMLTDISSPELDILTPDNGLSTPEHSKSPVIRKSRASSETPDLFKKCLMKEPLYIDDEVDRHSNSSTGTYTIEGDNYTEEQKARMSIDRKYSTDLINEAIEETLSKGTQERDPELIFDFSNRVITKEPRRDIGLRVPLTTNTNFDIPKVSKDKNVLEISCCYESPTESDLAVQTSKQIKSTRSYLEKIKNRVRTITEKTFSKSPPKYDDRDFGSFTSVTTSGVLSSKCPYKETPVRRRCSLTKSEIDQTDYIHRLSRESSVPVSLPSSKINLDETKFESTALKNAQKALRGDSGVSSDVTSDQVVGKLSYLSLNRCKGDKTWIQDWAESVKKYNNNTLAGAPDVSALDDRGPLSPRQLPIKSRSPHGGGTPTKIPSPVGTLLHRRTPDLIPTQDTETYLLKTQNAITNLQAKLQTSRTNNFSCIPSQLTSSLISEKTAISRLPVSQLSRSNSLNYRLRRKDNSGDSSPLRSPNNYVITGSSKLPEATKKLLNSASRSLEAERRKYDSNMNSPISDRGLLSNSSDDKTLSNRPEVDRKHKAVHKYEATDHDVTNANDVCLKTVLKNNALESKYPRIDQTRCQGDKIKRVINEGKSSTIKRSSSFNTVNKNNNYLDGRLVSRRSSGHSEEYNYSDDSDNGCYEAQGGKYKRQHRRVESNESKTLAPTNSPRCPNTPEMQRKFGPGLVRSSVRVTNKDRVGVTRAEPVVRDERVKSAGHQSRRISEPTRQAVLSRLTKSRSSTREVQPKSLDKSAKKPSQYRSSSALATKEIEFSNWKKRSSYDPMKAAQEARKKQQLAKKQDCHKDDLSSPSHSSPVHRSQSFHVTNISDLVTLDYSSEGTEEDQVLTLPVDPMITSTHSDIVDLRRKDLREKRQGVTKDVKLGRNYVANFQVNQREQTRQDKADKRKTFIIDDITPTKENIHFLSKIRDNESAIDKRRTFIMDSDTNSTTNGSSPRNSSIFSHEKNSLTTCTSDTEGDSGPESAPVVMRHQGGKRTTVAPKQRYSGDYSVSSNNSATQKKPKEQIQPRYLDISKYKSDNSPKNFLRRDPSKTYVGVLNTEGKVSKGSAQHYEMEQKKQELEKWKRRASYDPRKAAAQGKTTKGTPKTASSVLRSQSFHGPMLTSMTYRYQPPTDITETYDVSSDNDF